MDRIIYQPDMGDVAIEPDTNPWVEVDGHPVDWTTYTGPTERESDCDQCGHVLDGVIEAMDSDYGIQRCDQCEVYDGDLSAAYALAVHVGGIAYFEEDEEV